jgi:hypothetical protein
MIVFLQCELPPGGLKSPTLRCSQKQVSSNSMMPTARRFTASEPSGSLRARAASLRGWRHPGVVFAMAVGN